MREGRQLSLPAQLSGVLVAFTIEFDNTAEQRMAHSTTVGGRGGGPWLTSQVFWANVLQHIGEGEEVPVPELAARARTDRMNLGGLRRWGYIVLGERDGAPSVSLRRGGLLARAALVNQAAEIEARWNERFGSRAMSDVRTALIGILCQVDLALPDYLPLIFPAMSGRVERCDVAEPASEADLTNKDLSVLLSRALHAFALDVEAETKASLAMASNLLRVLDEDGIRLRDLPRRAGVSTEAITMMTNFYTRAGGASLEPDPNASRGKVLRLTESGFALRRRITAAVDDTATNWATRYGSAVGQLHSALAGIVGDELTRDASPLFAGLDAPVGGWRAGVAKPDTLPHFPMVLHRGGYPDGS